MELSVEGIAVRGSLRTTRELAGGGGIGNGNGFSLRCNCSGNFSSTSVAVVDGSDTLLVWAVGEAWREFTCANAADCSADTERAWRAGLPVSAGVEPADTSVCRCCVSIRMVKGTRAGGCKWFKWYSKRLFCGFTWGVCAARRHATGGGVSDG